MTITTNSPAETVRVGRDLAARVRSGGLILLSGPLGAGKSVVARGIVEELGSTDWRGSPTFTLAHEYDTVPPLYHLDLYRLNDVETEDIGIEEYVRPDAVTVVEWPERAPLALRGLVNGAIRVDIEIIGNNSRRLRVREVEM